MRPSALSLAFLLLIETIFLPAGLGSTICLCEGIPRACPLATAKKARSEKPRCPRCRDAMGSEVHRDSSLSGAAAFDEAPCACVALEGRGQATEAVQHLRPVQVPVGASATWRLVAIQGACSFPCLFTQSSPTDRSLEPGRLALRI